MKIDNESLTDFVFSLKIRFLSGKYFEGSNEIKSIHEDITHRFLKQFKVFPKDTEMKYIIQSLQNFPGVDHYDNWPDTEIVKLVKIAAMEREYRPTKPVIALDRKKLIILNILLFRPDEEVMFITTGPGGSGKSTFLNLIKQLFDNDVAGASLSALSNEFNLAYALKHRLIASDELDSGELDLKVLKTIISHQHIQLNPKFERPYSVKSQSQLFYCCNKVPRIDITDTGILRRIIYYEMPVVIKNPDTSKNHQIFTESELIDIAYAAYKVDMTNWKDEFKDETIEYLTKSNSVRQWMKKIKFEVNTDDEEETMWQYQNYVEWCKGAGYKPYSLNNYVDMADWLLNVLK